MSGLESTPNGTVVRDCLSRPVLILAAVACGVCAAFTAVGGWAVWGLTVSGAVKESATVGFHFLAKALVFTVAALGLAGGLLKAGEVRVGPFSEPSGTTTKSVRAALLLLLFGAALLVLPKLDAYPRAEPDETYHLVVARNLAQYGLYASGHPETGFTVFDPYDSVGPTVILPIAAVFRLVGPGLVAGRLVMAAYFLGLCLVGYVFCRPVFGRRGALAGTAMLVGSFGSVYLGRTLYGEVPALFYVLLGLLFWRQSLARPGVSWTAFAAGVCFGLAVLTKTILLLAAFPFLGALVYDYLSARRIRWRHVIPPVAGLVVLFVSWSLVQSAAQSETVGAQNPLVYYRHYLMFGIGGLAGPLTWFLEQPVTWITGIAAAVYALPSMTVRRYDPPMIVLFLLAVLYGYWWLFFTPGQIPRYMYYTCASVALLTGPVLSDVLTRVFEQNRGFGARLLFAVAGVLLVGPPVFRTAQQVDRVAFHDEMADDRALAGYVAEEPKDVTIGTSFFPVERMLNFMAGRAVLTDDAATKADVLIVNQNAGESLPKGYRETAAFGRYVVGKATAGQATP